MPFRLIEQITRAGSRLRYGVRRGAARRALDAALAAAAVMISIQAVHAAPLFGPPVLSAADPATPHAPSRELSRYWDHNGSLMRLQVDANQWAFYYQRPRSLMRVHGWRRGDLLFHGTRQGNALEGTVRRSSITCGPISYPARGTLSPNGKRLILTGQAPRRNVITCDVRSTFLETLVFEARQAP